MSLSATTLSRIQLLRNDLGRLLDNGKDSDVTVKVENREIKAHKIILKGFYF